MREGQTLNAIYIQMTEPTHIYGLQIVSYLNRYFGAIPHDLIVLPILVNIKF